MLMVVSAVFRGLRSYLCDPFANLKSSLASEACVAPMTVSHDMRVSRSACVG